MLLLNGLPAYLGVGILHLTLINIVVILIEWILLRKISKISGLRGTFIVLANIFSAFFGLIVASIITDNIGGNFWDGYIYEPKPRIAFITGLILFIFLTILIESPFYYWAMRRQKNFPTSIKMSIWINLITNIPIAIFYYIEKLNYIDE